MTRVTRAASAGYKGHPSALWAGMAACLAFALVVLTGSVVRAADPQFPALTGRVVDSANLLSDEEEQRITAALASLEGTSSDQLAVVTLPSLQGFSIEEFGYKLGRHWGIGQKDKDNGVLLIVAPNERKVRIETGKRIDPILTDTMSQLIISNAILPAFRRGDFAGGISAGVRDIKDVLLGDEEAVKRRGTRGLNQAPDADWLALVILAVWIGIFLYVMWMQSRSASQMPHTINRRRRRSGFGDGGIIIIPSGSGHWDGGWSGGGGGWSGGGGTFGGGGASGSW